MAVQSAGKAINTQEITDKARRELLLLLESVSLGTRAISDKAIISITFDYTGPRQKESRDREVSSWDDRSFRQIQYASRIRCRQSLLSRES